MGSHNDVPHPIMAHWTQIDPGQGSKGIWWINDTMDYAYILYI